MTETREIGVGLISVGWMGKLHTRAYQAMPSVYPELGLKCRLVIAADTAPDRVEYAKDVLGYERGTTDYREVLADPDVDVVSICAPNMLHREIGIAAAKAGKPFWIEKPVGRDAHETAEVAAAAREAGVATSIGYNYRHAPAIERMRELIADGTLGRITNIRSVFLNGYASEPKGALSWRFQKEFSGSGAMGDLLSHVADLVQYVVGPIDEVTALSTIVHAERPILPMGSGTHFAVIEDGEMGTVENEDYGAVLARFAPNSRGAGAVGTLECSRVVVGPQCGLSIEVYGTEGSATWNFERMNELKLAVGRGGAHAGYTTVLGNPGMGDYAKFQPGPGNSMGYDDLKVIEAKKFLQSVTRGVPGACTIDDAQSAAEVVSAAVASAATGSWVKVPAVAGRHLRRRAGARSERVGEHGDAAGGRGPGHGRARPGHRRARRRDRLRRRARPTPTWPSRSARSSAPTPWSTPRSSTAPRGCGCSPGPGWARTWSTSTRPRARGIAVVVTPGSGTRAVAEGVLAHTLALVKRLAPLTALVSEGRWAERDAGGPIGDLDGATIGIIGYGRIGRRVGELAAAFGMRVLAYDPFAAPPAEVGVRRPRRAGRRERRADPARAADAGEPPPGRRRVPGPGQAGGRPHQLRSRRAARPRRGPRRAGVRAALGGRPRRVRVRAPGATTRSSTTRASRSRPHLMGLTRQRHRGHLRRRRSRRRRRTRRSAARRRGQPRLGARRRRRQPVGAAP